MVFQYRFLAASVFSMFISAVSFAYANETALDWEVTHRFRVIAQADTERVFISKIFSSGLEASTAADLFDVEDDDADANFNFHIPTHWDPAAEQYDRNWFFDNKRTVRIRIVRAPAKASCDYRLDGAPISTAPCAKWHLVPTTLGKHRLSWKISGADDERSADLEVRDIRVASIGDSYSSGEGNPHTPLFLKDQQNDDPGSPAHWWDDRCHRSLISAPALAGMRMTLADKHASVSFVSYACSGATIKQGLVAQYLGRETPTQTRFWYGDVNRTPPTWISNHNFLAPQVNALKQLVCDGAGVCGEGSRIDHLVIGTGGNEVGFGAVLSAALTGGLNSANSQTVMSKRLASYFATTRNEFKELAKDIGVLNVGKTYIVTYLDPTKGEKKRICTTNFFNSAVYPGLDLFGLHISASESRFIAKNMLYRLEDMHRAVAKDNSWVYVGDFTREHGFCAKNTYFRSFSEAGELQGMLPADVLNKIKGGFPTGTMHPNVYGHLHVSGRLFELISK